MLIIPPDFAQMNEVLATVRNKMDMLFNPLEGRRPVVCVAFEAISSRQVDGSGNEVPGPFYHSFCTHPSRNGPIMGCLLVNETEDGEVVGANGKLCEFQVREGTKEAEVFLKERKEKEEFPF